MSEPIEDDAVLKPRAHRRVKWVPLAVLVGVAITQFAWAWGTPPFRGVDEIDHVFRAASVALGDVKPTELPADGRGALGEVPPGLAKDARAQCLALDYQGRSNCIPEKALSDGNVLIASSAAPYSPVVYAVIGTLARPWDGVTALYVMRGIASAINSLLLALAAWCLMKRSRTAWPVTGLVLGLTPMTVYTTMVPSPNGVELSAATVLWCSLLALQRAPERFHPRLFLSAALACAILGSIRLTGPIFVLLIVASVTLVAPGRTWELARERWRWVIGVAVVAAVAAGYQLDWMVSHPPVSALDARRPFDLGVILGQVLLWVFQWIGAFPLRGEPTSMLTYVACLVAFVVVFVEGLRRGDAKRWWAVAIIVTGLVLPLLYTLATFTEKGTFWQGRYALPLVIGAPILIGLSLDRPARQHRIPQQLVAALGIVATAAAINRLVSMELRRPASADDPHWHAPSPWVVVLLAAAAAVAFSRAMVWAESVAPSGGAPHHADAERESDYGHEDAESGQGRREGPDAAQLESQYRQQQ
jgi:hypothetical protein